MKKRTFTHSLTHVILFSAILAFTSCDRSSIVDSELDAHIIYDEIVEMAASQTDKPSPREVSDAFSKMVDEVQQMNRESIDSLSNEEIMKLGKPILDATQNTIKLSEATLNELGNLYQQWEPRIRSLTKSEHKTISQRAINTLKADRGVTIRNYGADKVREILLNIQASTSTTSLYCENLYNSGGSGVYIQPGDNLNVANSACPPGTIFYVSGGTYLGQSVVDSKTGNTWVGVSGYVYIDGQNTTNAAFEGGMAGNNISWMEIRNYKDYGIVAQSSSSTNIEIKNMTFRNIGSNRSGAIWYSAIYFRNNHHVLIQDSDFNNVTQSIRIRESKGPIQVLNNKAHNTGFGFFQCIECDGDGNIIRISNNSLEHTSQYGPNKLRDFINIFKSNGSSSTNRIQVNNNRARINLVSGNASGVADSGCFIILGDIGGVHQEAKNNIGVNPGNCGIGTAGGEYFKVENNKIFSQRVNGISNVGIYAQRYPPDPLIPCNHPLSTFSNNQSSYICGQHPIYGNKDTCGLGDNNFAYASPSVDGHYCGIFLDDIRDSSRVLMDTSLDETIWNQW